MTEPASVELILDRFGNWLRQFRTEAALLSEEPAAPESEFVVPPFGLLGRLAEEFTALRHEIKLQTKSSRGLEDQSESLMASLREAVEALRSVEPKEAQAAFAAARPLALALAELDEALERGRRQTEKTVAALAAEPRQSIVARLDEAHARQSWFGRLVQGGCFRRLREIVADEEAQHDRQAVPRALLEGYRLIQQRLMQTLSAEGVSRLNVVGRPVDPERMIVVEVVHDARLEPGLVFDEIRPGYLWNGRVLRCAEVRATRLAPEPGPDYPAQPPV